MRFEKDDRVRIREWDEMAADDNVGIEGDSLYEQGSEPYSFTKQMKKFCSCAALVRERTSDGEIKLFIEGFGNVGYIFRDWMLAKEEPGERQRFFVRPEE